MVIAARTRAYQPLGDRGQRSTSGCSGSARFASTFTSGTAARPADNDVVATVQRRIGANIMAMRMFEEGGAACRDPAVRARRCSYSRNRARVVAAARRHDVPLLHDGIERNSSLAHGEAAGGKTCASAAARHDPPVPRRRCRRRARLALDRFLLGDGLRLFDGIDPIAFASSSSNGALHDRGAPALRRSATLARIEACRAVATSLRLACDRRTGSDRR